MHPNRYLGSATRGRGKSICGRGCLLLPCNGYQPRCRLRHVHRLSIPRRFTVMAADQERRYLPMADQIPPSCAVISRRFDEGGTRDSASRRSTKLVSWLHPAEPRLSAGGLRSSSSSLRRCSPASRWGNDLDRGLVAAGSCHGSTTVGKRP